MTRIRTGNCRIGNGSLSVSKVIQRSSLVNDTNGGFLSPDHDTLNIVGCPAHLFQLRVDGVGRFNGGLCVEFCGIRDLEENVLHDIRAIRPLEFERFTLFARLRRTATTTQDENPNLE